MSDTRISEKALRAFMERAYEKEGFEAEEARQIADVLMQADLFGIESHGAQRMMYYHQNIKSGSVDVRARAEVLRETPVSALMDGHFAMGHLTAAKAMRMAIEKAKTAGIGMVAVRNSSHYGIAGYYPLMAEREGLAAFSMTNTGPIMVPTFGREMMLGTNPMAFCMPADPYPFWFDASTTVVTLGKVEVYNKRGKPMPEGWTIDGAGQPCSDAHRMNESILSGGLGGILPLGGEGERTSGHKGYGLAIMVEALTGVLAQGMLSPEMCGAHGDHTSHFFMAFDPAMFGDPAAIRARMSGYLQALRESEKAPGYPRIYTPGEKAHEAQRDRLQNGVPVEENTLADSIAVGVPRNADKALMAIRESNGIVVNVTDEEIMAAQKLLGMTCGVFGEPAGVTGAAGVKKLCEQGVLGENDTVVSVVTGNGLKDVANAIKFCGEPMSLPNDLTLLVEEFDKRGIETDA